MSTMLSHVRVVELAPDLGAYAGRILAELGAEVIKLEPPGGDPARRTPPFAEGVSDAGLPWLAWNTGKRSVELEPASADAQKLIASADVLLIGPDRHGLPKYETLSACNPRLVEVAILAHAEHGPRADYPASDLTLMAESGIMTIVGDPDRPPLKLPGEQAYALAGTQGAIAALMALHARRATGRGRRAVVSAFQAAVLANYREPVVWDWEKRIGKRTGNKLVRGQSGVRQVWACKDGFVTWSLVDNPGMIRALIAAMRGDELGEALAGIDWENTLLANAPQADIERWEAAIEPFFLLHTRAELAKVSTDTGMGLSQIDAPADVRASAQEQARGFWRRIDDQARGLALTLPGPLFLSSLNFDGSTRPAPALGEGNAELLRDG